jgi:Bacterial regulatory proteins, tetR family
LADANETKLAKEKAIRAGAKRRLDRGYDATRLREIVKAAGVGFERLHALMKLPVTALRP